MFGAWATAIDAQRLQVEVDLTHERLQSGSAQTDRSPPSAQAASAGVGRLATGLIVLEPFPKGEVLLSLTDTHGADTGVSGLVRPHVAKRNQSL